MNRRKKKGHRGYPQPVKMLRPQSPTRRSRLWNFVVGSGIAVGIIGSSYQYIVGDVSLEFVQPIGRAYEFQLKNDTPSDRLVKFFRIESPGPQQVIYETTEDVYLNVNKQGQVTMPGNGRSYVPAAEFKELDGQRLAANTALKFRIPPLVDIVWMRPLAAIVDVRFELVSANPILSALETIFHHTGLRSRDRTVRYLIIDNYWTVSRSNSIDEAMRVYCRDGGASLKSNACTNVGGKH